MTALFERSGVKSSAILILRLAVFAASAYLNIFWGYRFLNHSDFIPYSWGLIFGIVILVWQARSVREAINVRNSAFLFAAELIWLLVFTRLAIFGDALNLPHSLGTVMLATVLLTSAHGGFLGASERRVFIAIPSILGLWYLLSYVTGRLDWDFILNFLHIPHSKFYGVPVTEIEVRAFGVGQTIWQGAYLLLMFSPRRYWPFPFLRAMIREDENGPDRNHHPNLS